MQISLYVINSFKDLKLPTFKSWHPCTLSAKGSSGEQWGQAQALRLVVSPTIHSLRQQLPSLLCAHFLYAKGITPPAFQGFVRTE